jgi:RNA polymerase-interacting CarD/CdnL/TRCF family regulator
VSTLGELRLAVDDLVVYASHGVGRVASRRQELVMLEFERGLFVTLPIARAVECVRPVSTEVELAHIGRILGGSEVVSQDNWQRRLKTTRGKLAGGDAASLAEVVRDASRREERSNGRNEPSVLSLTERQLYVTARKLLADEIGASRGVDSPSADAWIGDQLCQHPDHEPARQASRPATNAAATVEATPSGRRARRRRQ